MKIPDFNQYLMKNSFMEDPTRSIPLHHIDTEGAAEMNRFLVCVIFILMSVALTGRTSHFVYQPECLYMLPILRCRSKLQQDVTFI
jgi:hypothetical protein